MEQRSPREAAAVGALLRRIRRMADCSQRELARLLGISATAVAQAETGARDLPATVLARAASMVGLRLGLLGRDGEEVSGMTPRAVRDHAGRHFPAHLDVRYGDQDWWYGDQRYGREQPWYTFDRTRSVRDFRRASSGAPRDHQVPQPGDSPADRVLARKRASLARQAAWLAVYRAEQAPLGFPQSFTPTCTCPAACDELLFASEPLTPRQRAVPHVDDCPCRCDIA